ncbi:AraC family transcriptional regulator N-terminal domain-containing protein [Dickeya dianthicola]|uniref:AraC family transcriptional regulator N-terminal domain-containing protein n=1 Tax=Dickeya dianthicola TaxID=204039 RepID=UPI001867795B|nr:AraC family transcriptional regulator [Dickeya dianthicola]
MLHQEQQRKRQDADAVAVACEAMVAVIGRWTAGQTDCATPIANFTLFRRDAPVPPTTCLVEPSIVLVVQGEKQMLVGGEAYAYNTRRLFRSFDVCFRNHDDE